MTVDEPRRDLPPTDRHEDRPADDTEGAEPPPAPVLEVPEPEPTPATSDDDAAVDREPDAEPDADPDRAPVQEVPEPELADAAEPEPPVEPEVPVEPARVPEAPPEDLAAEQPAATDEPEREPIVDAAVPDPVLDEGGDPDAEPEPPVEPELPVEPAPAPESPPEPDADPQHEPVVLAAVVTENLDDADDADDADLTAPTALEDGPASGGPLVADPATFRERWEEVQFAFVDAPRGAVEDADQLVVEVIEEVTARLTRDRDAVASGWRDHPDASTDDLRDAFQRYRTLFDQILAT